MDGEDTGIYENSLVLLVGAQNEERVFRIITDFGKGRIIVRRPGESAEVGVVGGVLDAIIAAAWSIEEESPVFGGIKCGVCGKDIPMHAWEPHFVECLEHGAGKMVKVGPCPLCGKEMEYGAEMPSERACDECGKKRDGEEPVHKFGPFAGKTLQQIKDLE